MKHLTLLLFFFLPLPALAQEEWPLIVGGADGTVLRLYELRSDSLKGNQLSGDALFSLRSAQHPGPVFGIYCFVAATELGDSSDLACVLTLDVTDIKFAGDFDKLFTNYIKVVIQNFMPGTSIRINQASFHRDELLTDPPEIIYSERPAILVLIDGEPLFRSMHVHGAAIMSNATYPVLSVGDSFYLYASGQWYKSTEATGPLSVTKHIPAVCQRVEQTIAGKNKTLAQDKTARVVFIRRTPAALIQSDSAPKFANLEGAPIRYVSNPVNDLFLDTSTNKFYLLLSGRWYTCLTLRGQWQYVPPGMLATSFSYVPATSIRTRVMASIAGTAEASNAVLKAGIPTIKKVKLGKALLHVVYDGGPRFQNIPSTRLEYAVNTQTPVIRDYTTFYAVNAGVWLEAQSPFGPWNVSVKRPAGVDRMPPSCAIYRIKFVDIYETSGKYVYMGYTAGYVNKFIYAGTVVYGTGYTYTPWIDHLYIGGPTTWKTAPG